MTYQSSLRGNGRHHDNHNPSETPFMLACQQLCQLQNLCTNWLRATSNANIQPVALECGSLRSIRLAVTHPTSGLLTRQTTLQLVLLPANFDDGRTGHDHQHWHILVYSWLGRTQTQKLLQALAGKIDKRLLTVMLVEAAGCERM